MELPKYCTELQSARRGRCRGHLGKPTQYYTLLKNIYTLVSIFTFSFSVVVFETETTTLVGVCAMFLLLAAFISSFPRLQLASYPVTNVLKP